MRRIIPAACVLGLLWAIPASQAEDAPPDPRSVTIDVVIASGPRSDAAGGLRDAAAGEMTPAELAELEKAGKLDWATRLRLVAVENDRTSVQIGERAPVVVGRVARGGAGAFGEAGGQSMTTMVNVGATIEAIARVLDDGSIAVNLSVEKSWLEPAPAAADAADSPPALSPPPTQRTGTLNSKSTVRVQPGEPTLVLAQSSSAGTGRSQTWIVLTASASAPPAKAAAAALPDALKVFRLKFTEAADVAKILTAVFDKAPLKVVPDVRTNSLLISGPAEQQAIVEALVRQIDQDKPAE
jgi:type II secretory pathway component HofQ